MRRIARKTRRIVQARQIHHDHIELLTITVSASDPLNLVGIVLPGPRVPAVPSNFIVFRDGVAVRTVTAKDTSEMPAHAVSRLGRTPLG